MRTKYILKSTLLLSLFVLALGCQDEALDFTKGADCGGCEGTGTNAFITKNCTSNGADLQAYSLMIHSSSATHVDNTFTIKNVGTATANLSWNNPVGYQMYLSTDGVTRNAPLCGGSFGSPIPVGGYAAGRLFCNPSVDPRNYDYIIIVLEYDNTIECNSTNNTLVRSINL